ncbi:MAG TPA: hypothetical protein VE291_08620 [Terracidiphilus sp.]|nr:hypothetical protein [Terracidiphilus sp.]
MRLADLERALEQQLTEDKKQLKQVHAAQNKLRPMVQRFNHLEGEARTRNTRMRRVISVLGSDSFETLNRSMRSGKDISKTIPTVTTDDLPLWEWMVAIVEQWPGIQVIELQLALEHFDRKTSRQSIESALNTHSDKFVTTVRGREKFVSLKGA